MRFVFASGHSLVAMSSCYLELGHIQENVKEFLAFFFFKIYNKIYILLIFLSFFFLFFFYICSIWILVTCTLSNSTSILASR